MVNFETPPCRFCNNGHNNVLPLSLQLVGMTSAAHFQSPTHPAKMSCIMLVLIVIV